MKKPVVAAAVAALVLVGAAWFWWQRGERQPVPALELQGNVDVRQVSLAFEGSGRVLQLRAQEGDRVKAGAVLAVLDTSTLRLQLAQAQAQTDVLAQTVLRLRNGSRPEEIAQARSRLAAAQAEAERAGQDAQRLRGIRDDTQGRAISAQDMDRAQAAAQSAKARVAELRDALRLAERGPRAEDVAGAQAQQRAGQAQVALLEHQISLGELKAPSDGVIRSRLLEVGDMAGPQRPVFALSLTQPKWVRVYVSEPDLVRVRPGAGASVWVDGDASRPLAGKVGYVSSTAEFTPKTVQTEELRTSLVYEVRVIVDDPGDVLRLGQPASVRLGAPLKP